MLFHMANLLKIYKFRWIEKQDKKVAKEILNNMGLEKEKYRLGYTKV